MLMPTSARTFFATVPAFIFALTLSLPGQASPPECNCNNLTSLQQDYMNAGKLESYFQVLAEHMQKYEADSLKDWGNPDKVKSDSVAEYDSYRKGNPPGQQITPVNGYTGPKVVSMKSGTCNQEQNDLNAMESGSPCKAIADAALNHEAFHRAKCDQIGEKAYWDRLRSKFALEEVEAYKAQAAALKDELRRVLDASEVTYQGDWTLGINVGGMAQYGYHYTALTEDIGGASGGDRWTMTGKGSSTVTWTKAVIMRRNCNPSGEIKSDYTAKITTDGLTFDLEVETLSSSGVLSIQCPGGGGGGGPGVDAGGGGKIATGLPVQAGVTPLPGDMGSEIRNILAGMGTVTGSGRRELSITCPAP